MCSDRTQNLGSHHNVTNSNICTGKPRGRQKAGEGSLGLMLSNLRWEQFHCLDSAECFQILLTRTKMKLRLHWLKFCITVTQSLAILHVRALLTWLTMVQQLVWQVTRCSWKHYMWHLICYTFDVTPLVLWLMLCSTWLFQQSLWNPPCMRWDGEDVEDKFHFFCVYDT